MVKVEVIVKDVDYGELIYQFLPDMLTKMKEKDDKNKVIQVLGNRFNLPGVVVKAALSVIPQDVKDDLLVKIINTYQQELLEKINEVLNENKVTGSMNEIRATKL